LRYEAVRGVSHLKRIVIFALAAIAVAAVIWLLGAWLMSAPESKENATAWPFGLGTISEVPARFSKSPGDAAAQHVKTIASRLTASEPMRQALQSYVAKQIGRADDAADAPAAPIRQFLDDHVAAIDELRTISGGAPPRWAIDIHRRSHETSPDIAAQSWQFRVLAADAFDHHRRGDDTTAWQDAATGWVLAQGLWAHPDLSSQFVALYGTRMMNDLAAKLAAPAPPWHRQLLAFDADRAFAAAMQVESWRAMTSWGRSRTPSTDGDDQVWQTFGGAIVRNVSVRQASRYAASLRAAAEDIARHHSCEPSPKRFEPVADAIRSHLTRFHIEREAVATLQALKEQRRRAGEWPDTLPDIGTSLCGENSWRYRREADGSMSLSFGKQAAEDASAILPLSFRYPK
jgi:hypothetical protein